MPIQVQFDEKIHQRVGAPEAMEMTAQTVQHALYQVAAAYPGLHMFNCEGQLRSILRFAKNGLPATLTEPLADGDTVQLSMGA